ncbi:MAG: hypothetical protein KAH20_08695 [Methylococcales bacterium]|nr:hypothetical protein [Methylococcales bacterium]
MTLKLGRPKKNILQISISLSLYIAVLLLIISVDIQAQAIDCNSMKFLKSKSQGISVNNNACVVDDMVSVGSRFLLIPGGRLWLKTQTADSRYLQLICQNRATREIEVELSNKFSPWIRPKGFTQCSDWINNKLSCSDEKGSKNDLICAIAVIEPLKYLKVSSMKRTTSIKLRTLKKGMNKSTLTRIERSELIKIMAGDIRSEVSLCRNLYQVERMVKATWTLGALGQIEKLLFSQTENIDHQFRSCVESVIYNFEYPEFSESVVLSVDL